MAHRGEAARAGRVVTEVCVDSAAGARAAAQGGADRIELCAVLDVGGVTPSAGLLEACVDQLPTHVLVRPRPGNFGYRDDEIRVMAKDVEGAVDQGAAGVVIGALTADGAVDLDAMRRLLGAAGDLPVTFHRAFDVTADPLRALDDLLDLGIARLLTSGGRPTAVLGAQLIAELVRRAGDELVVMAGSGITAENVAGVIAATGVREVHFSARPPLVLASSIGQPMGTMDRPASPPTTADRVRAVAAAATSPGP